MKKIRFRVALVTFTLLLAGSEVAHAGKLMRFARWAGRETVKAALVEYAKHEAGENFEAFRQKFCGDRSYRQKVLSSPAISPLIAGQPSAEELIVETLGCGYNLGKVNVVFTDVVPGNFGNGRAKSCEVKGTAYNYSKYHLDQLVVDLDGWKVSVEDMVANAYAEIPIPSFDLDEKGKCSNSAQWLNEHAKEAGALRCSVPGMAEGDCQELISVLSTIDVEKIKSIETQASLEFAKEQSIAKAAALKEMQRNRIYWNKIIRAVFDSPSNKFVSVAVIRPTVATGLSENFVSGGWETRPKFTFPPCTGGAKSTDYFVIQSRATTERRSRLPAIPDGYVVASTANGASRYWIIKMDDLMPYGIYFGAGAIESCKTTDIGIEITTNRLSDRSPSGQMPSPMYPMYPELTAIQW